ncbi:MAG: glutamine amidotransferase [Methanomicrobiales archaeon]|jgi:putative intracellular protease/amidase|nr:glutamine amidotransferase [Methanomicrobiales archaeon]
MKEQVLFIILEQYADWEYAFLSCALQGSIQDKTSPYEVKTVSLSKNPIKSIGGFTTIPDYAVEDIPSNYAGIILIGGMSWRTEGAKEVASVVKKAYADGKIVGAICDATVFLGMNQLLNEKKHTSNIHEDLISAAQGNYTGQSNYLNEQAVRDNNLITANGTGYLEFTREVLTALNAYPADYIEDNYQYFKIGFIEFMKNRNR